MLCYSQHSMIKSLLCSIVYDLTTTFGSSLVDDLRHLTFKWGPTKRYNAADRVPKRKINCDRSVMQVFSA